MGNEGIELFRLDITRAVTFNLVTGSYSLLELRSIETNRERKGLIKKYNVKFSIEVCSFAWDYKHS